MRKTKNKAVNIAKVLLCLAHDVGITIDHLKLQKLLYFAQALSLVRNDKPMFTDTLYAWDHGPVVKGVYNAHKSSGRGKIVCEDEYRHIPLSLEDTHVLEDVLETFKGYTGVQLRNMTHKHLPWKEAYEKKKNSVIPPATVKEYYTGVLA